MKLHHKTNPKTLYYNDFAIGGCIRGDKRNSYYHIIKHTLAHEILALFHNIMSGMKFHEGITIHYISKPDKHLTTLKTTHL